jgi:hypothetical protein
VEINSIPPEEFAIGVSSWLFTDAEIAGWIRSHRLTGKQKIQVLEAIGKFKGGTVTGVIRSALREMEGLPPVPGDEV